MKLNNQKYKIAIVHEWFEKYAGSEKVIEQLLQCFPDAELFSIVDFMNDDQRDFLNNKEIKTTYLQKLPFSKYYFRIYLLMNPTVIETIDLSEFDIIISSNHAFSKGVITGPNQLHICLCYSPMRYIWDLQFQYLKSMKAPKFAKAFLIYLFSKLRLWDYRTSVSVDYFISISKFISKRIHKFYKRSSEIIYPPVDLDFFTLQKIKQDYYVAASRFVEYKKLDLIIDTFKHLPDKKLIVIGDGPKFKKLNKNLTENIQLLGWVDKVTLKKYLQNAKALIFSAEEDFGLLPLEAQSCGTPVICYGKGGALETVIEGNKNKTGMFFYEQTVDSLKQTVCDFDKLIDKPTAENCRKNAEKFSQEEFRLNIVNFVNNKAEEFFNS